MTVGQPISRTFSRQAAPTWTEHLDTLPAQLKLDASRKLAAPRIQHLNAFLRQANAEGILNDD